jgi:peptidoglycan/xylan/chitin deacetylase (PgdA/CDA1 family)
MVGAGLLLTACEPPPPGVPNRDPSATVNSLGPVEDLTSTHGAMPIALTFDDGPNPAYTPQILDILDRYGIHATFFVVGQQVAKYPDLLREIVRRGHTIANHSWNHPKFPKLTAAALDLQLSKTDQVITETTGLRPTCVRPPYGATNRVINRKISSSSHVPLTWTVDPNDWKRPGAGTIASRVISLARPGGVVLMHDGGGDRSQTVAALPLIIQALADRGFEFVTTCRPLDTRPPVTPPTSAPVAPVAAAPG